ncbi:LysE family translocator [Pseudoalteromonas sp. G4]|uniref:LysE family translocator n=1 Tax=Pseudoalteromonas sp. G4 TaxID=2992761 RepID=UPI00237D5D58|nr:LysE family translocator [Pseudoalteromonas sp. G4]MDE3270558.1 LysE family translocator [Pseudoalteromonas sp. G4]
MNTEILIALVTFCFVSSITPGPNNLLLLSSGLNFGLKRSLNHLFGVTFGFAMMVLLVGIGIGKLFNLFPISYEILKWVSIIYLSYLAYKIANNHVVKCDSANPQPFTFLQAVIFQWVNPKAWTMAISVNAIYANEQTLSAVLFVTFVFLLVNFPAIFCWLVLGKQMKRFIESPLKVKLFNWIMAALLVCSIVPML